jgi:hypothetical protein
MVTGQAPDALVNRFTIQKNVNCRIFLMLEGLNKTIVQAYSPDLGLNGS